MKRNLMAFAFLFNVINGFCQNAPIIVQNIVAGGDKVDQVNGMDSTADKGLIISSTTFSTNNSMITRRVSNSFADALVIRYDQAGNILWSKCYGGSRADVLNDIKQTADGGFIAVGRSSSTNYDLPATNDSTYGNIWVLKLSATGNVEWSRVFGGSNTDDAASVIQIADGSYIIAAYTGAPGDVYGSVFGENDLLIIKLDANGANEVFKRYGGTRKDVPAKIIQLANGKYVVVGSTYTPNDGIVTGNHSPLYLTADIWVVWLDSDLSHIRNKCYGGVQNDLGVDVLEMSNGDLIIAGTAPFNSGGDIQALPHHSAVDGWVARINPNETRPNDIVWARPYGGNRIDNFRSMAKTPDGNIVIGLQTYSNSDSVTDITDSKSGPNATISDVWLAKVNPADGAIISRRCYGTSMGEDLGKIISREEGLMFGSTLGGPTRDADLYGQPAFGATDLWIARLVDSIGAASRMSTVTKDIAPHEQTRSVKMYLKSNSMVVNYTGNEKQAGVVQLLDVDGKLIKTFKVSFEKGYNSLELNTGALVASKIYIGLLSTGNHKYSVKMVR